MAPGVGAIMSKHNRGEKLIPPWEMPSDPVKAVFWFMQWLLQVLVRFFWIPILVMVIIETYINWRANGVFNGLISGVITLLIGLGIWLVLYVLTLIIRMGRDLSRTIDEVTHLQQGMPTQHPFSPFNEAERRGNVVEGTITDLDEERKKRRQDV
jgi:hypothetical protein